MEEYLDDDGYPTKEALDKISNWEIRSFVECEQLLDFVRSLWTYSHLFRCDDVEPIGKLYRISTGGWSGNESLIDAMQQNRAFWGLYWSQSRRGGHYIFMRYDKGANA